MRYPARIPRTVPVHTRSADPDRNPAHLAWIRKQRCATEGPNCAGAVQAAHVRLGTGGGMAVKPADRWTVPLCRACHAEQHQQGERTFWTNRGIDPRELAASYYRRSPARRDE